MERTRSARARRSFAEFIEGRDGSFASKPSQVGRGRVLVRALLQQRPAAETVQLVMLVQAVFLAAVAAAVSALPMLQRPGVVQVLGLLCLSVAVSILLMSTFERRGEATDENNAPADMRANRQIHSTIDPADAQQLVRLKSQVSHELRTPLNAVIGFSEMMSQEVLGPVGHDRYREYATHIRESAKRFQCATEKTLAVTEMLARPADGLVEAIELKELLRRSIDGRPDTQAAPVVEGLPDHCTVVANRAALENALHHLWAAVDAFYKRSTPGTETSQSYPRVTLVDSVAGSVDMSITIAAPHTEASLSDGELTPGSELSLLLAKLGTECAGGKFKSDMLDDTWCVTITLPGNLKHQSA